MTRSLARIDSFTAQSMLMQRFTVSTSSRAIFCSVRVGLRPWLTDVRVRTVGRSLQPEEAMPNLTRAGTSIRSGSFVARRDQSGFCPRGPPCVGNTGPRTRRVHDQTGLLPEGAALRRTSTTAACRRHAVFGFRLAN